ncbi:hypothetical protein BD289DRAFT_354000, partial [Coniella lustricola]
APARKSLPTSSLAPAAHTSAGPPAASSPIDKMSMASVISPMPGPPAAKAPISMTSKEWVIPPRPKPGRKPATDTPPTKRKAQNRAAQRAFRERRAARVGELEEQLEAEKDEHDAAQRTLQDKVHRLELDAQALQSRCEVLENMLDKERAERAKEVEHQHQHQQHLPLAPQPLRYHRPSASSRPYNGRASTSSLTSLTPDATHRPATTNSFSISQIISPPEDIEQAPTGCGNCEPTGPCACADDALTSVTIGCGNCTLGSRCQCLEEVLNGADHITATKRTIRSISPSSMAPDEKRPRSSVTLATEIDFTAIFSRKPQPSTSSAITSSASYSLATLAPIEPHAIESPRPEDRCGFCEDGTYCVCAEAAANNAAAAAQTESITLPSIHSTAFSAMRPSQQIRTPPPSEGDAIGYEILPDGSVKLPSLKGLHPRNKPAPDTLPRPTGGCGPGGPGTCAQCLSDPKSGLFCRSLAANFGKGGGGGGGGCCGGGGPGGGRCKDKPSASSASNTNTSLSKPSLGLSLSCADAYKTLASHKHFSEAADDINTWLPLLRAAPKPREPIIGKDGNSRTPIEVEAASIMGVLKGFDVRFGRGE